MGISLSVDEPVVDTVRPFHLTDILLAAEKGFQFLRLKQEINHRLAAAGITGRVAVVQNNLFFHSDISHGRASLCHGHASVSLI